MKINIFIILVVFLIKGLRLILVNSQIFNFFMAFVTIVVKSTKHE